jgi:hypothetical protein
MPNLISLTLSRPASLSTLFTASHSSFRAKPSNQRFCLQLVTKSLELPVPTWNSEFCP